MLRRKSQDYKEKGREMEVNKDEGVLLGKEFFYEEEVNDLKEEEEKELMEFISSGNLEIDRKLE